MTRFAALCAGRADIPLASDSPVLSSVDRADFSDTENIIVVDGIENRVFGFDNRGRLTRALGRRGGGPAEYQQLVDAAMLPGQRIAALDRSGRIAVFSANGLEASLLPSSRVSGAACLAGFGNGEVLLATSALTSAYMVHSINLRTGAVVRSYGSQRGVRAGSPLRVMTGVAVGSDAQGAHLVTSVTYEARVQIYERSGAEVAEWALTLPGFVAPTEPGAVLRSRDALTRWARSFSHVLLVTLRGPDTLLLSWDRFVEDKRHYFIAAVAVKSGRVLWSEEVPFRPLRSRGSAVLFLDRRREPSYVGVLCRRFGPRPPNSPPQRR
ncbi:MAG TPA: 6-bladed beta-propeller [Steroidobacteraceae bacterium]|nr:6-bladed beta-propeller [Steroidobacteraceae bacterium]